MTETGIYMIQSISKPERIYIGSTSQRMKQRWGEHLWGLRKGVHHSTKLQRHYNKYGIEDLEFSILESGAYLDKNHLHAREQGWYTPYSYRGAELPYFNESLMAGSPEGRVVSKETKDKISRGNKGQIPWNKGLTISLYSIEAQENLNNRKYKGKHSEETKRNIGIGNRKPIIQFDLGMYFIKEWSSITEAATSLGISIGNISACLTTGRKTAGGFIWKYKVKKVDDGSKL